MTSRGLSAVWVRIAAAIVLAGGMVLFMIGVLRSVRVPLQPGQTTLAVAGPQMLIAFGEFLPMLGLSALLTGVAALLDQPALERQATIDEDALPAADQTLASLAQLRAAVESIPAALAKLQRNDPSGRAAAAVEPRDGEEPPRIAADAPELLAAVRAVNATLAEIRELTLLDDAGKRDRLAAERQRRRAAAVAEVDAALRRGEFARAEKLVAQLPTDGQAADADAARLRDAIAQRRAATADEAIERVRGKVDDLIAVSAWDQALALAQQLSDNFPQSPAANALVARVAADREQFRESTIQKLYDEVKADLDARHWRRALAGAERLVGRFPDHRRADKLRPQLNTIRNNAEIEERQEQEARIQDLIRHKHFNEAIERAEALIHEFPDSPQAESLEALLPKLRGLSLEHAPEAGPITVQIPAADD